MSFPQISDFNIVRLCHRNHRCQYGVRFVLEDNSVIVKRLKNIYGAADKLENETADIKHQVDLAVIKAVAEMSSNTSGKVENFKYSRYKGLLNNKCIKSAF